ncbi:hypothetical protein ABFA07_018699 [Porites harrisoni]
MADTRLKIFLLCTLFVATASLLVMFYYSEAASRYTRIGLNYIEVFRSKLTYVGSRTRERSWMITNNTSQWDELILNSSTHDPYTSESLISTSSFAPEANWTTDRDKLTEESTQQVITKRNVQEETKPLSTTSSEIQQAKELCPSGSKQVGPLYVDQTVPKEKDLEREMSSEFDGWVNKGGCWRPTECQARVKMALITPYRNRYEQLLMFVRHMHPMLKRQNLDYRIFVIEQAGETPFNRAMLFNIGYKESLKFDQYECFIFHDIDLIPEDDRNEYSCPSSPRHLSVAIDKFSYRLPYSTIFGGAGSLTKEHFKLINGFSNKFWGWGGEDDDLYNRIAAKGLKLTRPSMELGRYKMVQKYHKSAPADEKRMEKLRDSAARMATDGLNSMKYTVNKITEHLLYTQVTADVKDAIESER